MDTIIKRQAILKTVRAFNREARMLFLGLCSHIDHNELSTPKQKETARKALAKTGEKMLAKKEALPSDPSQLRMRCEQVKQKCASIVSQCAASKEYETNAQIEAIRVNAANALETIGMFIEEYNAHKEAQKANEEAQKANEEAQKANEEEKKTA